MFFNEKKESEESPERDFPKRVSDVILDPAIIVSRLSSIYLRIPKTDSIITIEIRMKERLHVPLLGVVFER